MFDLLHRLRGLPAPAGDSMLTVHLEQALASPGCPLCGLTAAAELRYFESLWYEYVNDRGVNEEVLASRGYCTEHTRAVFAGQLGTQSPSGVARLFARFLRQLLRHSENEAALLDWLQPKAVCPVCVARGQTDSTYLPEFARLAPHHTPASEATGVLCMPHLEALAPHVDAPVLDAQQQATTVRIARDEIATTAHRLALVAGRAPLGHLPPDPTCPVCQAAALALRATLEVSTLCRPHAWALHDADRRDIATAIGAVATADACPACQATTAAVEETVGALTDGAELCIGHLRAALQVHRPVGPTAIGALEALCAALERFRDSFDYRYTGTRSAEELASWENVLARFGGQSVGASVAQALPFTAPVERNEGEWWRRLGGGP